MAQLCVIDGDYSKIFNLEAVTTIIAYERPEELKPYCFRMSFGGGENMFFCFETVEERSEVATQFQGVIGAVNFLTSTPPPP